MKDQEISNLIRDLFEKSQTYSEKGKECIGIVCEDPTHTVVLLIRKILNDLNVSHFNKDLPKVLNNILKQLEYVKVDGNNGMLYFPNLPAPEEY